MLRAKICPKDQVRINGICKTHKIFGKITGIDNIVTEHHTKGSDTYNVDIGNNTKIKIWQGPPDFESEKRTMYFEDIHVKNKLTASQIEKLNQISKQLKYKGIKHAKDNFISVSPKKIITKEKYGGDDVIYTYHGSMNYMPQKKGIVTGWTGNRELDVYKPNPNEDGEYEEETVLLEFTKSVLDEIKDCGYNLYTEKGEDAFMEDARMNYEWTQKLLRLAKKDFEKVKEK